MRPWAQELREGLCRVCCLGWNRSRLQQTHKWKALHWQGPANGPTGPCTANGSCEQGLPPALCREAEAKDLEPETKGEQG